MYCPECSAIMLEEHHHKRIDYACTACGHVESREVGKKKHVMIRLYDYQKQKANIRGGVQFVVDTAIDEIEDEDE